MHDLFAPWNDVCAFDALRPFVNLCGRVVVKFSLLVQKAVSCMIYNAVNSEEASAETMFSLHKSETET